MPTTETFFGEKRARKRWDTTRRVQTRNDRVDAFLADIVKVCRQHRLSISHEDWHGAFQITKLSEHNLEWLGAAHDATGCR